MKQLDTVTKCRSFWIKIIKLACVVKIITMNSMTVLVIGSLYSHDYSSIEKWTVVIIFLLIRYFGMILLALTISCIKLLRMVLVAQQLKHGDTVKIEDMFS